MRVKIFLQKVRRKNEVIRMYGRKGSAVKQLSVGWTEVR